MHMYTHEDFINMILMQNIAYKVQNILNINFEDRKEYVMLIISILWNLKLGKFYHGLFFMTFNLVFLYCMYYNLGLLFFIYIFIEFLCVDVNCQWNIRVTGFIIGLFYVSII